MDQPGSHTLIRGNQPAADRMRELLARTADYGSPAAEAAVPGRPPRHDRVLYLCSSAARPTVTRAAGTLGALGARIEIRDLPPAAALDGPGRS